MPADIKSFFLWLGIGFGARSSTKCRTLAAKFLDSEREFWRSVRCSDTEVYPQNSSTGRVGFESPHSAPGTKANMLNSSARRGSWPYSMDHQPTRSTAEVHHPASGCQGRGTVRAGMKSKRGAPWPPLCLTWSLPEFLYTSFVVSSRTFRNSRLEKEGFNRSSRLNTDCCNDAILVAKLFRMTWKSF